jgi:hypothetical protein
VPKPDDIDAKQIVIHAVDDPIRADYNFANRGILEFRDHAPQLWKICQTFGLVDEELPEASSPIW